MSKDKREDAGEFYPGGKIITPVPQKKADPRPLDGQSLATNSIPAIRESLRKIGTALGATVTCIAIALAADVTIQRVPVNEIDFDANVSLVTNITGLAETATKAFVTNRIEQASDALRGEIAAKADATGVHTNFTAATGTTNDIWVSDIDGTVLRCVDASRWIGTGTNSYGFVRDIDQTPPSIQYNLHQWVDSSFTLSLLDPETGEELAVPVVIGGQHDAVWLDWDTVATNDTLVGRFDNPDWGIHIGPYHLRRHGGVEVSETRVVYTSDLDFSTNNTELVETIEATAPTPDFSTNNTELVETIEELAPAPDLSPFLRNDKAVGQIQTFGGMLKGKFLTDSWYSYIVNNPAATPSSQTLPLYVGSTISNTVPAWARAASKPTYSANEVGAWPAVAGSEWGLGSAGLTLYLSSGYLSGSYCFGMDSEWHVMRRRDLEAATNATLAAAAAYTDSQIPSSTDIANVVTSVVPSWALAAQKPTYTASEVGATSPAAVSNIVTTALVRERLGVWMEYDEATGYYYYCHEEE